MTPARCDAVPFRPSPIRHATQIPEQNFTHATPSRPLATEAGAELVQIAEAFAKTTGLHDRDASIGYHDFAVLNEPGSRLHLPRLSAATWRVLSRGPGLSPEPHCAGCPSTTIEITMHTTSYWEVRQGMSEATHCTRAPHTDAERLRDLVQEPTGGVVDPFRHVWRIARTWHLAQVTVIP